MRNQGASTSDSISLPKGGGALSGIGETFSPNLFTGTGNFSIPIDLPPGRNGFQPELNLVYSSGNGNGPFGLGWALSIPGVARKTARGIPQYHDAASDQKELDTFILSGAEDLVPVESDAGTTRYRPRTEGLFARIHRHHDTENDYWEVKSKDGLASRYGTSATRGDDPAACANPDPNKYDKVFMWKLSETRDTFGNRIEYEYLRDRPGEGTRLWDQLYLKEIRYADYTDGETTKYLVKVIFHYEDRPDPFSDYRAGFEMRTTKRCTHIEVHTDAEQTLLVRTVYFQYLDKVTDNDNILPLNRASLLHGVTVSGHDGDQTEPLPPIQFDYTRFDIEQRTFTPVQGHLPARSMADPSLEFVDLFGNGLPDIIEMAGTTRYWRNLGNGRFDLPKTMESEPAGVTFGERGVRLMDANGDGRADLLVHREGLSGYYPLAFGGLWNRKSFQRYEQAPSFDFDDAEVQLVDLDGDGITDVVRSGSRFEYFFNDADEGWNHSRRVERRALDDFPNVNFSDPRVRWADMSGDGLQDIVLVHDGNVEYWPNLGHGNWGRRISMRNGPRFPYGYDPARILIGDVDGDGVADIVYVDHCKILMWINRGGNDWSDPIEIDGTPPVADNQSISLFDLSGTGVAGILWSQDQSGPARHPMHFLDFTGGVKPYLLHEMTNNMGAVTRVEYASSTKYYLEDQKKPETRWQTPLPFPVLVVSRVEVLDQISGGKLTTEYSYHHGYWDGEEREFRGFARVDQRDTEVFARYHEPGLHGEQGFLPIDQEMFSPPMETRSWFHQGAISDDDGDWYEADYSQEYWAGDNNVLTRPETMVALLKTYTPTVRREALRTLRGQSLRTELYALDGTERQDRPYTVSESLAGVREESPPASDDTKRRHIFFAHALASRTTQWERGNEPMTQLAFIGDYDDYGQARESINIAVPRGRQYQQAGPPGEPYLATMSKSEFAQRDDDAVYIVDRAARATSFEIRNDGSASVFELVQAIRGGSAETELIGQSRSYYDGEAFVGLPLKEIGDHGVPMRSETLVLTDEIIQQAYADESETPGARRPPYLAPEATPPWTGEYPQVFRDAMPERAGYVFYPGDNNGNAAGYYTITARQRYDFQESSDGRGLLTTTKDPLGFESSIQYDRFQLMPIEVTNAIGLTVLSEIDYRVMQPRQITEPNGNRTAASYTPLGLVTGTAVLGKEGEVVGDTLEVPGTRLEYDFFAFANHGQPVWVRTIARVHHINDTDIPEVERNDTIETIEYSDGFGRLLQTRTQAEELSFGLNGEQVGLPAEPGNSPTAAVAQRDANRVVVSGWQVYDNKGQIVEQYEPFFDSGWDFQPETEAKQGRHVTIYYDPRGQVVRTLNPDGSEQRVIFGVPTSMDAPDNHIPTPWESYSYDPNDLASLSLDPDDNSITLADRAPESHHFTPVSTKLDALGRVIKQTERNGPDPDVDWYVSRTTYDIRGNVLTIVDALDRVAFKHEYDLANNNLRIASIDAGLRTSVLDAVGNLIEYRDSKGSLALRQYDALHRPTHLWAHNQPDQTPTLREFIIYGDDEAGSGLDRTNAKQSNHLGQLLKYYDEAGVQHFNRYDFKGNLLEKNRHVISDVAMANAWVAAWENTDSENDLDGTPYQTDSRYDGLNRPKEMIYPEDVDGHRAILKPEYNRAGALEQVKLDETIYVDHIAYDAKGQRVLIALGNGVMTRYRYDAKTFRLQRLRSERYQKSSNGTDTWAGSGAALQDFTYAYDLVGNILGIEDRIPNCGIAGSQHGRDRLVRNFDYDPIYRLKLATGRACKDITLPRPLADLARCGSFQAPFSGGPSSPTQDNAPELTEAYIETYHYDAMGNMRELGHTTTSTWNRRFTVEDSSNRLVSLEQNGTPQSFNYDANGNMRQQNTERHHTWDHADRMIGFRVQPEGATEPSLEARYLYGADGIRVKKWVRKGNAGNGDSTVYIDEVFEYHKNNDTDLSNCHLHVMDDQQRIALVRRGPAHPDDAGPAVQYHLGDHLGSCGVVIDNDGQWINREEFFPYGETSFGSFGRKRYRFTGKERDEESGLNYHGARYYYYCLVRWINTDPAGPIEGTNVYQYVNNNPLILVDLNGHQSDAPREVLDLVKEVQGLYSDIVEVTKAANPSISPADLGRAAGLETESKLKAKFGKNVSTQVSYDSTGGRHTLDASFEKHKIDIELKLRDSSRRPLQRRTHIDKAGLEGRTLAEVTSESWEVADFSSSSRSAEELSEIAKDTKKVESVRKEIKRNVAKSSEKNKKTKNNEKQNRSRGKKSDGKSGGSSKGGGFFGALGKIATGLGVITLFLGILYYEPLPPPQLVPGQSVRSEWIESDDAGGARLIIPIGFTKPNRPVQVYEWDGRLGGVTYEEAKEAGKKIRVKTIRVLMR